MDRCILQENSTFKEQLCNAVSMIEFLENTIAERDRMIAKKEKVHNEILHQLQNSQGCVAILDKRIENLQEETVRVPHHTFPSDSGAASLVSSRSDGDIGCS